MRQKEITEVVNQELMNKIKEIRDILGSLDIELNVASRATVNVLITLSDHLAMDYINGDISDFSKTMLKNTHAMRSLLNFVDEVAQDLLERVTFQEKTELV